MVADLAEKLPGRGAWVSARRDCIETAVAKGLFAKAFKSEVTSPSTHEATAFAESVASGVETRALAALGLARRAGAAQAGFEKVREALAGGRAAVLLTAADAADGGAEKLARIAGLTPVVRAFSIARQSGALGIDKAVHVIIEPGPHANRFLREIERLAGFREVARPGAAA